MSLLDNFKPINLQHFARHIVGYLKDDKDDVTQRDAKIDALLKSINEEREGVVRYRKSVWQDGSDFDITGVAPSYTNNAVQIGSAYGSWDTSRVNLKDVITNDRNWSFTIWARMVNLTLNGFAVGKSSVNTWGKHELASAFATNSLSAALYPEFSGANTTSVANATMPSLTVDCIVKIEVTSVNAMITTKFTNILTGGSLTYVGSKATNTGKPGFATLGSTLQVLHMEFRALCKGSPETIIIGDSKSYGTIKDSYITYADLLNPQRNARIFAGPSDRIEEAHQCLPNYLGLGARQAVVSLMRNNLAASTFNQANQDKYKALIDALKADKYERIVHLVVPETTQSQTSLITHLQTNFTSSQDVVLVMPSYNAGTDLSDDSVHLKALGQLKLRNDVEGVLLPI